MLMSAACPKCGCNLMPFWCCIQIILSIICYKYKFGVNLKKGVIIGEIIVTIVTFHLRLPSFKCVHHENHHHCSHRSHHDDHDQHDDGDHPEEKHHRWNVSDRAGGLCLGRRRRWWGELPQWAQHSSSSSSTSPTLRGRHAPSPKRVWSRSLGADKGLITSSLYQELLRHHHDFLH